MFGRSLGMILALLVAAGSSLGAQTATDKRTIDDLREAVLRLPYYGVFDFVSFSYEQGTATLSGFVYQPKLKQDIINAVKRVSRVDDVVDQIEVLPVSHHDDEIRWRAFTQIYGDSVLSRYAPGGGVSRFDVEDTFNMRRFPGTQPFGSYPIKIIVNRGHILLVGHVDSKFDKTIAGARAREVEGSFGVENALTIPGGRAGR
jgi:osmotically-inducible protein OsmY